MQKQIVMANLCNPLLTINNNSADLLTPECLMISQFAFYNGVFLINFADSRQNVHGTKNDKIRFVSGFNRPYPHFMGTENNPGKQ
ncbi:hypothetical protein SDC9_65238 [bioreactor metagenome]|uniref:Uncharacterized protein n=1 Tax=bioreactor metagenome TaxID=1076179 RepID=A0A644XRG2_9ZZZZ